MTEALAQFWAPRFAAKTMDTEAARDLVEDYVNPFDFSTIAPVSPEDFQMAASKSKKWSAPGPDGIPFGAWAVTGDQGAMTLYKVAMALEDGEAPPLWFVESETVTPPKGDDDLDRFEVTRKAADVRPIALKNSDNKLVASVYNRKISSIAPQHIHPAQRGFVKGRHFVQNILDLDTQARMFSMTQSPSDMPALVFWDYEAAFPSVSHEWIFAMLRICLVPESYISVIEMLYHMNSTYVRCNGALRYMCSISAGVLQGCPLSGSLFAIAIDPILARMARVLERGKRGILRACADDIGAALASSRVLPQLHQVFELGRLSAGLTVNVNKCVVVPIYGICTLDMQARWRDWLAHHVPAWACFKIASLAKYLGVFLGPKAGQKQWHAQHNKWVDRARAIANMGTAASISVFQYNTRAVSSLSYIMQFCSPPAWLMRTERWCLAKILHIPYKAYPDSAYFAFRQWGGLIVSQSRLCHSHACSEWLPKRPLGGSSIF